MPAEAAGTAITAAGSDPVRVVPEVSAAPEVRRRAGLSEEVPEVLADPEEAPAEEVPADLAAPEEAPEDPEGPYNS